MIEYVIKARQAAAGETRIRADGHTYRKVKTGEWVKVPGSVKAHTPAKIAEKAKAKIGMVVRKVETGNKWEVTHVDLSGVARVREHGSEGRATHHVKEGMFHIVEPGRKAKTFKHKDHTIHEKYDHRRRGQGFQVKSGESLVGFSDSLEGAKGKVKERIEGLKLRSGFDEKFRNPTHQSIEWMGSNFMDHDPAATHGYVNLDRYRRHDHGGGDDGDDWLDDDQIEQDWDQGVKEHGHRLAAFNQALKDAGFKPNAMLDLGEKGHLSINFTLQKKGKVDDYAKNHQKSVAQGHKKMNRIRRSIEENLDDLIKGSGEGSRGGKITGHTRSGKPVYENANHPDHGKFGFAEHYDAMKMHRKAGKAARAAGDEEAGKHHLQQLRAHGASAGSAPDPKITYAEAHAKIRAGLKEKGWDVKEHGAQGKLKVPHATSPEGHRVFFKKQAIHRSAARPGFADTDARVGHSLATAHSMFVNAKKISQMDPEDIHKRMGGGVSKSALDETFDLIKGPGEGSKGGKVVGHTSSGKPIYANANHPSHSEFGQQDHKDAKDTHFDLREKARDSGTNDEIRHHIEQIKAHRSEAENKNWTPTGKRKTERGSNFDSQAAQGRRARASAHISGGSHFKSALDEIVDLVKGGPGSGRKGHVSNPSEAFGRAQYEHDEGDSNVALKILDGVKEDHPSHAKDADKEIKKIKAFINRESKIKSALDEIVDLIKGGDSSISKVKLAG